MKTVNIQGNYNYPNTVYLLNGMVLGIIENSSCLADAQKLFANSLDLSYNGIFLSCTKQLRPDCKSHKVILAKFGINI